MAGIVGWEWLILHKKVINFLRKKSAPREWVRLCFKHTLYKCTLYDNLL